MGVKKPGWLSNPREKQQQQQQLIKPNIGTLLITLFRVAFYKSVNCFFLG